MMWQKFNHLFFKEGYGFKGLYHVEYLRTLEDMDPIIKGLDKKFGM